MKRFRKKNFKNWENSKLDFNIQCLLKRNNKFFRSLRALEAFVKLYVCDECHAQEHSLFDIAVHWNTEKHRISAMQLAEYDLFQHVADSIKMRIKNAPKKRKEEISQLSKMK